MSLGASDFLTDEELEELGEDGHSHITYVSDSDKKVRKKKTLSKPPLSPRSPYLTSASLNPRRSVASIWRTALSQSPMKGDYELPQSRTAMPATTPEYLKEAFGMKKPKHSRSATNGYIPGTPDFKDKEDMYDEILELKKALQAQKADGDRMKAKLRRLEEENTKKEKQIQQLLDPTRVSTLTSRLLDPARVSTLTSRLLDPTRVSTLTSRLLDPARVSTLTSRLLDPARVSTLTSRLLDPTRVSTLTSRLLDPTRSPEYTRSLVDKKTDGKSVVHGLKQKVLRLEQQCREKETALSKLQSELRTTNMEEMKITMETYYEEVQRLRVLLESAEKSNKIESTENRRQQKVLRATVLKLTQSVKQLEEENARLKEEAEQEVSIVTESPANRAKGYMEWSKQRLVRRLLDTERRLEELRNRHTAKDSAAKKNTEDSHLITTATRPEECAVKGTLMAARREAVSVSTETDRSGSTAGDGVVAELRQECVRLKGVARRLREERSALQESLAKKDEELRGVATDREEAAKEAEKILSERMAEHENQAQQYREEIQNLSAKIRDMQNQLEEEKKLTLVQNCNQVQEDPSSEGPSSSSAATAANDEEQSRREQAAKVIQTHWHAHRIRDIVLIQSALRSHLSRQKHLLTLREQASATHSNNTQSNQSQDGGPGVRRPSTSRDGLEEEEVTLLQSVFRGHLRRCTHIADRAAVEREAGAAVKGTLPPPLSSLSSSSSPSPSSVTPAAAASSVIHTPAAQHSCRPRPEGSEDEEIEEEIAEEDADDDYSSHNASSKPPKITVESDQKQAGGNCDSDDSDDIIVSPSRPMGRRMSLLF
ncbi:IQ domain-containing protein E isoform X1 [Alosa pseudoharengus]|uniref:IQ domain-containing protein E isoform X1 n=1 Tax=Alosa pseudoharengus TaxID=34774 RepID=UPI003F8B8C23